MMHFVDDKAEQLAQATEQVRRQTEQQESVDEAVFMSSFLPRSLNQVSEVEIQKLATGEVEDTYAHAVASLTGNQDVVAAVAEKLGRDDVMTQTVQSILKAPQDTEATNELRATENCVRISADSQAGEDDLAEDAYEEENGSDDESESDDGDDSDDSTEFVKRAMTPEEHEAAKAARRAERRENKKAVKDAQKEKRKEKIKKKDKKRAIKKSKAGNRKG
jgi:RIO kinase 1